MKIINKIILILFFLISTSYVYADKCKDYKIYDAPEDINSFGMDTTNHWWALLGTYSTVSTLIIDGQKAGTFVEIRNLIFSPDGNRWAFFGRDNVQWHVVTNDTIFALPGTDVKEMQFSPNSEALVYSYMEGDYEVIIMPGRRIHVYQRQGTFFLSQDGRKIAFMGYRGDKVILNINGIESTAYDDIKPFGFSSDGKMIYAVFNGITWEVFRGEDVVTDSYSNITETAINLEGTVAAFIARQTSGNYITIMLSDEYYNPIVGKPYDAAYNLILHPHTSLVCYAAQIASSNLVVLNNTEYSGGLENSKPMFTYDGSEIYFAGCDIDCFLNISGKKYPVSTMLNLNSYYAKKPGNNSIAYSTSSSMIVREIESGTMYAGMMVDTLISPRYNWREDRYETLGKINKRLYLLTCAF
ncbi:MAG: hypothetical protein ABSG15_08105 [FCB group bacterium]|jgi:hypothetical protein